MSETITMTAAESDLKVLEWLARGTEVGETIDAINLHKGYAPEGMPQSDRLAALDRLIADGLVVEVDADNARYSITAEAVTKAETYRSMDWRYDPKIDLDENEAFARWCRQVRG